MREKNNEVSIQKKGDSNEDWATFVMIERGDLLTPCSLPIGLLCQEGGEGEGRFLGRGNCKHSRFSRSR